MFTRYEIAILGFVLYACSDNLFKKDEKVDPLVEAARYIEMGDVDGALRLVKEVMPEAASAAIDSEKPSLDLIDRVDSLLMDNERKPIILSLLSIIMARKSGVNLAELGAMIANVKDLNPDDLINSIMKNLESNPDIADQIDFAIGAARRSGGSKNSDKLNEAVLQAASIAARLKSLDINHTNKLSASDIQKLSAEDSEKIYQSLLRASELAQDAAAGSTDKNVLSISAKLTQVNTQIDKAAGNTTGEKTRNFMSSLLGEVSAVTSTSQPSYVQAMAKAPPALPVTVIGGKRVVRSMAVFGDSLAVGIGSGFKRGSTFTLSSISQHPEVANLLSKLSFPGYENYRGDLDQATITSYDSAYSATPETIKACKTNQDPNKCFSHAARLKVSYLHSYATSGSQIGDVKDTQLPAFIQANEHVDYVTINVGGNDFCSLNGRVPDFTSRYRVVLQSLLSYKSHPIVMIAGIPNVVNAFSNIADETSAFTLTSGAAGATPFTCGDMRWMFCPRAAASKNTLDSQWPVIVEMTTALRALVTELDPQGTTIFFADKLSDLPITNDFVGIDCFHANIDGYHKIGDLTFKSVTDALLPNDTP